MKFNDPTTGKEIDIEVTVSEPTGPEPVTLTEEDVWGKIEHGPRGIRRLDWGMIIYHAGELCKVFEDEVPYKAVTVKVYGADMIDAVTYWLEFVQGANSVTKSKMIGIEDGVEVWALRSEYQCW